jgi:hypothetical protein
LAPSLLRSLTLPAGIADYGTPLKLFDALNSVFLEAGFAPDVSESCCFFVLGSWVAEMLPESMCLPITGARAEGLHLLQILACLVRRPLPPLLAPSITALASLLPNGLAPALLINAETLPPQKLNYWLVAGGKSSNVIVRGRLIDLCKTRAIFIGESFDAMPLEQPLLIVNVEPSSGPLPIIGPDAQAKLTSKFQPQLLEYRRRNLNKIPESMVNLVRVPTAIKILASILNAAIVGVPELQARFDGVLARARHIHAQQLWLDPRGVVVEAALARSHEPNRTEIRVGELTDDVIALLRNRGQKRDIEPRKTGAILTKIGISRERLRDGFTLEFDEETRKKLHRLARVYGIPVTEQGAAKCPECLAAITDEGPSGGDVAKHRK